MAEPKTLTILGYDFTVDQPYDTGHVLTEGEAKALNQTRKENLGNNFRKTVQAEIDLAEKESREVNVEALTAQFAELNAKYEFTIAAVAAARKFDPLEKEVRRLIKEALRDQLSAQNKKLSDVPDEKLEAILEANMENEAIVKLAKKNLEAKQKAASVSLSGFDDEQAAA